VQFFNFLSTFPSSTILDLSDAYLDINVQYLFVIDAVVVTVMQVVTFFVVRLKLPSHFPKVVGSRLHGEQSRATRQNHSAR